MENGQGETAGVARGEFPRVGRYRLLELLGSGGFAEVYKAEDSQLSRLVALKLPRDSSTLEAAQILREARAAARLSHPGIAAVYEVGENHPIYIASEYVEGRKLADLLSHGPLEVQEALDVVGRLADALDEAHRQGIIHCDLKPANIVVTPRGTPKILDFGLAQCCIGASQPTKDKAETDQAIQGTIGYMSPEQLRSEVPDARTDLFSLGALLYECLTGTRPFFDETIAGEIRKTLHKPASPVSILRPEVPPEIDHLVRKTLEKDREKRYQTASELRDDLARLRPSSPDRAQEPLVDQAPTTRTQPVPPTEPAFSRWLRRLGLRRARPNHIETERTGVVAFRGLLPFQESDKDCFFGREQETASLLARISHQDFRFGVLFGESGCGKTSLLRAGLIPRLRDEGFVPVYCRSQSDPLGAIFQACRRQTGVQPEAEENLIGFLDRVTREFQAPVVVLLDQFEETLVAPLEPIKRSAFVSFVSECYHQSDLAVRILFSIRSDFLFLVESEFADSLPDPLLTSRLFQLRPFSTERATAVLERSAISAALPFEAGLSTEVAADLAVGDRVAPAELQIVGEQLQRSLVYTVRGYQRAGCKAGLVNAFLEQVLESIPDREGAELVLRSLISDEGSRLALTGEEIARRTQRASRFTERVLALFVSAHLVRASQEEIPWTYELMHDYLIEKVNRMTGRVVDAVHRANYLFREYLKQFQVDPGARIPLGKLWFIRRYSDLKRGEAEEKLLRSSLRWGVAKAVGVAFCLITATLALAAYFSIQETWESTRLFDGHRAAVRECSFHPDGKTLVTAGEDGRVIIWDFLRRERVAEITRHKKWVKCIRFSPDGRWLVSGGEEGAFVWDAATLRLVKDLGTPACLLAFSSESRYLALTRPRETEGTVVWDTLDWKRISKFGYGSDWQPLLFLNDSKTLAAGNQIYEFRTGRQVGQNRGLTEAVLWEDRAIAVGANGRVVFSDASLRNSRLESHPHSDHGRAAAFSPDGRWAASGAEDILLWDVSTLTKVARFEHTAIVWDLAFSPDGKYLVSTHGDGAVLLWDYADRKRVASLGEHSDPVRAVAFSPDGRSIASAGEDKSIILWDANLRGRAQILCINDSRVNALRFGNDGRWLAFGDQSGKLALLSLPDGKELAVHKVAPLGPVYCVDLSSDNEWGVTGRYILSVPNLKVVAGPNFSGHRAWDIYGVAFSPDGRLVARCGPEALIGLLQVDGGKEIDHRETPGRTYIALAYSPDGRCLVTGEDEGYVRLWEVQGLREVAILGKHSARVKSVAFSPDGRRVVSASDDRTIALWDADGSGLIGQIGTQSAPVLAVAFSRDGKRVVAGGHDRSVRLYTRHRSLWGYLLD